MKRALSVILTFVLLLSVFPVSAITIDELLTKADGYIIDGDYERALVSCDLAVRLDAGEEKAYIKTAEIYLLQNDFAHAAEPVEALLQQDPVSADGWSMKCRIDMLTVDLASFERDRIYAEVCGASLDAYFADIARLYMDAGQPEKTVEYFGALDPASLTDDQAAVYKRALMSTGQETRAIELGLKTPTYRDTRLDQAFENDALRLVRAELPPVTAADLEVADAAWAAFEVEKTPETEKELAAAVEATQFTYATLSPTGSSGLISTDGNLTTSFYDGKYHILYPDYEKSMPDNSGCLERMFSYLNSRQMISYVRETVYSPDGRYAAVPNHQYAMAPGRFEWDPIIIDLATGAVTLTACYGSDSKTKKRSAVSAACFSKDGRYLYYMINRPSDEKDSILYRYSLEKKTTELCYRSTGRCCYPELAETVCGDLMVFNEADSAKLQGRRAGIAVMSEKNDVWTEIVHDYAVPAQYWKMNELLYSDNSGFALTTAYYGDGFVCFKPDENFRGFNRFIAISNETDQAVNLTGDEWQTAFPASGRQSNSAYQIIDDCRLSPDGHYALLKTIGRHEDERAYHLYMLRLEDLEIREVRGLDPNSLPFMRMTGYPLHFEWNAEILLIQTNNGVEAYRFE